MKLWSAAALVLALLAVLTACNLKSPQTSVSESLGIDAYAGNELTEYDTHSGNGDGVSCIALSFEDDSLQNVIQSSAEWSQFPLDKTTEILVYGFKDDSTSIGPYICDENQTPLVPDIQNGYYLLIDRQPKKGEAADSEILDRASFNLTVGLYDCDADILYCLRLDT